jgi:hypothetical protein
MTREFLTFYAIAIPLSVILGAMFAVASMLVW